MNTRAKNILFYKIPAWIAALILLQTLYFKFTAHPDSVYVFTTLGAEPTGRIGLGIIELITSILLVIPKMSRTGALLGAGIMSGAIISHIFILGLEVRQDGGTLFILACIAFACCLAILFFRERIKRFEP